jgi:hypothetical protein
MSEEDLDRGIDRAVHEVMNVDTDGMFRARVMARLAPRRRVFSWPRLTLATAAGAAIVLAFVMTRPQESNITPPSTAPASTSASSAAAVAPQPTALRSRDNVDEAAASARRAPAAQNRQRAWSALITAAVAEAAPAVDIEPLQHIEPINVEPLQPTSIQPDAIVVAPLAPIVEVQVIPMTPQTERD